MTPTHRMLIERGLSPKMAQIMELAAEGYTLAELGRKLGCSVSTVNTNMTKAYSQLGISGSSGLIYRIKLARMVWEHERVGHALIPIKLE